MCVNDAGVNQTFLISLLCFAGWFAGSDAGLPHLLPLSLRLHPGGRGAAAGAQGTR